jgi:hypothetical protein
MPLHCLMKASKQLQAKEIEQDLIDIVRRRFNGLLKITSNTLNNEVFWNVGYDEVYNFPVCLLKTGQSIDFIHNDNSWSRYAQQVIEEELAQLYQCPLQDEEYPHNNLPPPETHPTFRAYLETSLHHHSKNWRIAIIEIELSKLPLPLKKL